MDKIYYSPGGYWHGETAVKKLAAAAGVSADAARAWLEKQPIYQIYQKGPKTVPRSIIEARSLNDTHQADLLYLPHDKVGRKTYKYCLCVVDVFSRYKEAEPLVDKTAAITAAAIQTIYKRGPLKWPRLIQVDASKEFMGAFTTLIKKHKVIIRTAVVGNHRQQGIVERFNRTLAERLFKQQYHEEFSLGPAGRSTKWVEALPEVVRDINDTSTRLLGKKPNEALLQLGIRAKPARPRVGPEPPRIEPFDKVRYLYDEGELEGGRRRATDPIWSLSVHHVSEYVDNPFKGVKGVPTLYKVGPDITTNHPGPARPFVREELFIIPADTALAASLGPGSQA